IHNIEQIEKLRTKLQNAQLIFSTFPKRSVLDQREIKLMKRRPTKCISSKCSESSLIGPGASWNSDGNKKERFIVCAASEIIFAHGTACRKIRHLNQVGPVRSVQPEPCLLYSRINGKRRTRRDARYIQQLPA